MNFPSTANCNVFQMFTWWFWVLCEITGKKIEDSDLRPCDFQYSLDRY